MFKIGDFSRLTQVTVKALRHYDDLGLLKPAHVDSFTGYRYYTAAQLPRLNRILAWKDLGLSLDQIGQFLDADLSAEPLRALLLVKRQEVRASLAEETARLGRIEARLRQLTDSAAPGDDVVLKRIESQPVAGLRKTLPARAAIGELFRTLAMYQRRHGLVATAWTAVWHDPDFRETEIDAEATFSSTDRLPPDAQIQAGELVAVETMACVAYQGSGESIGRACRAVMNWIDLNGFRLVGPERVRSLGESGPVRSDSVVELQFPVEKDRSRSLEVRNEL